MYRKVFKKQTVGTLYGSLLTAMVAGRIVWGIVKVILSGIAADAVCVPIGATEIDKIVAFAQEQR